MAGRGRRGGQDPVFGYRLTLGDQFERLAGYPEYNKNT